LWKYRSSKLSLFRDTLFCVPVRYIVVFHVPLLR
jgi:hypothetical protein